MSKGTPTSSIQLNTQGSVSAARELVLQAVSTVSVPAEY